MPSSADAAVLAMLIDARRRGASIAGLERVLADADPGATLDSRLGLLAPEALGAATRQISNWLARGFALVTTASPGYPRGVRELDPPPAVLFITGEVATLQRSAVAVIGTRRPSTAGTADARRIATLLAERHQVVASGLAHGIDAAAHDAALAAGGRTLAVLATGVDRIYPSDHAPLADRILGAGGLVSQFWPGDDVTADRLRVRNATLVALARAVIVVEAGGRSGTRIAARHAAALGRPLVALDRLRHTEWARTLAATGRLRFAATPEEAVDAIG